MPKVIKINKMNKQNKTKNMQHATLIFVTIT